MSWTGYDIFPILVKNASQTQEIGIFDYLCVIIVRNMKKLLNIICSALLVAGLCGCEKLSGEKDQLLRLNFPEEITHYDADSEISTYTLNTNALAVSFDILSGAGGYTAMVSTWDFMPDRGVSLPCGVASVEGNTVTVELLESEAEVIVSDRSGAQAKVFVRSSNSVLQYFKWDKYIPYGGRDRSRIEFGAGAPYEIVGCSGRSAEDASLEGSTLETGMLMPGAHWYLIRDCRGTTRKFDVHVRNGYDIEGENLTVQARAGERMSFPFLYGKGWKVVEGETGPETFVHSAKKDPENYPHDTFFVMTGSETVSYTCEDAEGHRAVLTIEIE